MIVKNESKIIEETILSVSKFIDYWIISDTGSTDNTIEIITKLFNKLDIPGKIYSDEWIDFGTNRTKALEHAKNICDYILIIDADDLLMGELIFPKDMNADGYYLKYGKDYVYIRQQLFKSSLDWRYRCVVHEYPECINKSNPSIDLLEGNYYIDSRRLGARNTNPQKYLDDAIIMENALDKDPELNTRYLFYIAQSYFDYCDFVKALHWYRKRIVVGGWIEEVYFSNLRITKCMEKLNYAPKEIIKEYLITHSLIQERPEALFGLGIYLCNLYFNEKNIELKNEYLNSSFMYLNKLNNMTYNKSRDYQKLFLNKSIFDWACSYELAYVSLILDKKKLAYSLCCEILNNNSNRLNEYVYDKVEKLKYESIEYDEDIITSYPKDKINLIINKMSNNNSNKHIVLTMTTCKRLHLFKKTINSFINCCKDIDLIDEWIFVDDNSSLDDIEFMKYEYPFIKWIFKKKENKGHSISMNILRELTKNYKYIIHLEDDWLFIDNTYYIKPALDILESSHYNCIDARANDIIMNKEICQVLFNKNYAETLDTIIYGGYLMETKTNTQTKFILHEHYPNDSDNMLKNKCNCAYWPHYSLRPSIFKRKILDILGPYDDQGFFERIYADKYFSNNFISCFYDKITCLHIGKLTKDKQGINAYDLNSINQNIDNLKTIDFENINFIFIPNLDSWGNDVLYLNNKNLNELMCMSTDITDCICFNTYGYFKNKLETTLIPLQNKYYNPDGLYINVIRTHNELICINLKRREDRKINMVHQFSTLDIKYKIFEAIDGNNLEPTKELIQLFKNNDFGTRKGIVGSALSHKKIWEQLVEDKYKKYYIIIEDDCELHQKFNEYLTKVQEKINKLKDFDILFMAYTLYDDKKFLYNNENFDDVVNINIIDFDKSNYIGGFFGYIISKSGATKLLNYISTNGIKHGIDYLIKIINDLNIYQLEKFIIKSDRVLSTDINGDSDIQKNYEFIDIYSDENFQYFRCVDSYNDDIIRYNNLSIDELKNKALNNKNCVCFNTLGFMKSKVNELTHSQYFKNIWDGIYIKKNQYANDNIIKKKYIRIKMICNWTDSKTLCDEWNWMSKGNYKWENIQITWEDNDIDFYVIINKPKHNDFYIPEKTIIYQMEPQCESFNQSWGIRTWGEWANPDPHRFFMVRTSKKYLNNVLWQLPLTYDYFKNNVIIKDVNKSHIVSSICSSKYFDPGHIKRIDFLKYIEEKNDDVIQLHIFNRDNLHNFKSYQGKLEPYIDKHNGLIPYKYYFMCENNAEYNFITEKIWEPIICETLVFYWGCPNITDYINPLAFVQLDMEDYEKSYLIIKNALENNLWEQRIQYIKEEKNKILDYYNFFPTLKRILYYE